MEVNRGIKVQVTMQQIGNLLFKSKTTKPIKIISEKRVLNC